MPAAPAAAVAAKVADPAKKAKPVEERVGGRNGAAGGSTVRVGQRTNAKKAPTGSGGHKFEWKDKTNDGTTSYIPCALDAGDPMYSSGPEDDGNYVLVSEGADLGGEGGAPPRAPRYCAEHGATLYYLDYLASSNKVNYGCHGYVSSFVLSIFDREWVPNMTEAQGLELLKKCIDEIQIRFLVHMPEFSVKIVDKDGVRVLEQPK